MTRTRPSPLTVIVFSAVLALIGFTTAVQLARADHSASPGPQAPESFTTNRSNSYLQRPLTEAGCCPAFTWSADSTRVRFLDTGNGQSGWWSVGVDEADLQFDSDQVGYESPTGRYLTVPEGTVGDVRVLDRLTGTSNLLSAVGGGIRFSPDESRIVFSIRDPGFGPSWQRSGTIYLADPDGGNRQSLIRAAGSVVAWFPDGERLLVSARRTEQMERGLWELNVSDASLRPLLALTYFRAVELSPDGRYISYIRAPEPDTALAGLWILDTVTLTATKMALSGSYAWRPDGGGLIVIPAKGPDEENHQLWWVDVEGNPAVPLTDPATVPLNISNLEWNLSPDSRKIAYRGAEFLALWVLDFGLAFDTLLSEPTSARLPGPE